MFDTEGNFAGLVGVDIEADEVLGILYGIRLAMILTIVCVLIMVLILSFKLINSLTQPLFIDGLTGTYNHKFFQETLATEIDYAKRHSTPLTIMMIDIDHFKNVNDKYGHRCGDTVLMSVAKVIKDSIRTSDVLARYGGEEFMVILRSADIKEAYSIALRVCKNVESFSPCCTEVPRAVAVTVSIGVAEWEPELTKNQLIDIADKAMYISKQNRNTVTACQGESVWA